HRVSSVQSVLATGNGGRGLIERAHGPEQSGLLISHIGMETTRRPRMSRQFTFRQILERVAEQNAAAMMARARTANRVAKALQGRPRAKAYSVKHDALLALFRTFPDNVRVISDPAEPNFVLLALRSSGVGLHAPATHFTDGRNERCAA